VGTGVRFRVLVIDDDPAVRLALARVLSLRHDVESAGSADEALSKLASGTSFDAIVCDVVMPERSGLEFLAEVRARFPEVASRVVLITGGAIAPDVGRALKEVQNEIVEKPFALDRIEAAIARASSAGRQGA
jgi:DNA-binding NtrC family response regulator